MTFNFHVIHEFLNSMLLYIGEKISIVEWFALSAGSLWALNRQFGKKPPLPPPEPPQEP